MKDQLPFIPYQRIALAGPALPVKIPAGVIPPQGIYVDYGKCAILLLCHMDPYCGAVIMNQVMCIEYVLPCLFPSLAIVAAHGTDPKGGIVGVWIWRPRPHHVMMEYRYQFFSIPIVPGIRLPVDHILYLLFNWFHSVPQEVFLR
jgi:hypothetical protein